MYKRFVYNYNEMDVVQKEYDYYYESKIDAVYGQHYNKPNKKFKKRLNNKFRNENKRMTRNIFLNIDRTEYSYQLFKKNAGYWYW